MSMRRFVQGALTLAAMLLVTGTVVRAQLRDDYEVLEPAAKLYVQPVENPTREQKQEMQEKLSLQRSFRNETKEMLRRGTALTAEEQTRFQNWYLKFEFPSMTLYTPEALKEIPEARKRLIRENFQIASNSGNAQQLLVSMAFDFFSKVATSDYHPAVRVNAMLIIGELNQREMSRSGGAQYPPDPLPKALVFMLDQFESKDQIDAVRVAALVGIQRHAQLEAQNGEAKPPEAKVPPAVMQRLTDAMLTLVRTPEAPEGRTQAGHDWMRRRAVDILGWGAHGRLDQTIVDELIARAADSDEERGIRRESVSCLGRVMYVPNPRKPNAGNAPIKIDIPDVATKLASFAVEMANLELEQINAYIDGIDEQINTLGGASSGGYGGGYGPSSMEGSGGYGGGSGTGKPTTRMKRTPAQRGGIRSLPGGSSPYGMEGGSSAVKDPYLHRLEPAYRKLRHEITCVMRALKGTDEFRRGDAGITNGIYTAIQPTSRTAQADKEFIDNLGRAIQDFAVKLKVKEEEIYLEDFEKEVDAFNASIEKFTRAAIPAKKRPAAAPPAGKAPPAKADDMVPDPAGEIPEAPMAAPAAKAAPKAAPAAKKAGPMAEPPAPVLPDAPE